VVLEALIGESLAAVVDHQREAVLEAQPFIGFALNERCDLQAFVEVKTRTRTAEIVDRRFENQPISVYLTVRQYGPLKTIQELQSVFGVLAGHIERIAEERVVPHVVVPLRERLTGG
jgi:hypothetical protein